jgi:diguanylate cyclase (GGDEF)-like protein
VAVQKRFGDRRVPPPPVLGQLNQTALADLVIDSDGTVRRGLLSAKDKTSGELYIGLAARAALSYLAAKGIKPEPLDELGNRLKLGQAQFQALHKDDGGYVGVDANGYQILLNFRGQQKNFQTVSLTQVLFDQIPRNLFRDRIVFIGTTAESIKDFFYTPYDNNREAQFPGMAGVFIHANLSSQILSAALDERHPVRFIPNSLEWLWAAIWSVAGVLISWHSLQTLWIGRKWLYGVAIVYLVLAGVGLLVISYLLFLEGWWVPVIPALVGLTLSAITYFGLHSQSLQRLAYFDGLTQVANRRYFDQRLARQVHIKGHLSLMLCDVDYFKLYNDAYGHQAGDACLQKVAVAIRNAVRRTDLVARYGGEEFAVILPHTNPEAASRIAERVLNEVRSLQLPHIKSLVADHVTLSCGVVSVEVNDQQLRSRDWSTASLIAKADEALYICKREGRDRFTVKGF